MMFLEFRKMINGFRILFLLLFCIIGDHVTRAVDVDLTSLTCGDTGFVLGFNTTTLNSESLQPWTIAFDGDNSSECSSNKTLAGGSDVEFNLTFSQCGMNLTENNGFLIYSQDILVSHGTGLSAVESTYHIECEKNYTLDESLVDNEGFNTSYRANGHTSLATNIDNPFNINMVHKSRDGSAKTLYKMGEIIDVELHLQEASTADRTVYPQRCFASSESGGGGSTYDLITGGCPIDPTTTIQRSNNTTTTISFQAFRFKQLSTSEMYVNCEVVTCLTSVGGDARCADCSSRRRKRRDVYSDLPNELTKLHSTVFNVSLHNANEIPSKTFRVTHHKRNEDISPNLNETIILTLLITLLFILAFVVVKWICSRLQAPNLTISKK